MWQMRIGGIGLALGMACTVARADEYQWQPVARPPAVTLGRPVTLGAPIPVPPDSSLQPVSHVAARLEQPVAVVRAQSPDAPPPGVAPVPASPEERFNCGVVTEAPASGHFLNQAGRGWFGSFRDFFGGLFVSDGSTPRTRFQSDHGFDVLISPVTNPFLFEDPRALTEFRPVFINQGIPGSNPQFGGGQLNYFGLQGRLAFTERLSVVLTEFGWLWINPSSSTGLSNENGAAEVRIGPKYTFYRCEPSGTVAALGLMVDIPVGSSKVFQNTGDLSLQPYLSVGQNFGRSTYGSFNFVGNVGYSVATDSERSDFLWTSLHLDYDVGNLRKFYPFLEFNYFYYAEAGNVQPFNFEGRDLINFGSQFVKSENTIAMAVGLRYKISECIQFGGAYEFPVSGNRDLLDYRLTFDLIFRY